MIPIPSLKSFDLYLLTFYQSQFQQTNLTFMRKLFPSPRAFFSVQKTSLLHEFRSRNLLYQSTSVLLDDPEYLQQLRGKSVYCGYDPSADSLHLGNLVSIVMMARLSLLGLKPIFLVGGATGLIGDPSGKSKERPLLAQEQVQANITGIQNDLQTVYGAIQNQFNKRKDELGLKTQQVDLSLKMGFKLRNNYDFYKGMNAVQFLRDVGKHFRLSTLLARETVANRLKTEEGISYTQFSYSIVQAYDFYRLWEQEECRLQFGGSDQWGNIANGCDFIRKKTGNEAFGITMPLLLTKSGQKFGKSEGNALFLSPHKTPSAILHQYLFNTADDQVERYLRIFTFLSESTIQTLMKSHLQAPHRRLAQTALADNTLSYLGGYLAPSKDYFKLSHEDLKAKDSDFFANIFADNRQSGSYHVLSQSLKTDLGQSGFSDLAIRLNMAKSKSQIRRQVQKGGIYINNRKMEQSQLTKTIQDLLKAELLHQKYLLLRWGKKNYHFIELVQ